MTLVFAELNLIYLFSSFFFSHKFPNAEDKSFFPPVAFIAFTCFKMSVLFANFTKKSGALLVYYRPGEYNSHMEYASSLEEKGQILYYCVAL